MPTESKRSRDDLLVLCAACFLPCVLTLLSALGLTGCASAPPPKPEPIVERIKRENRIGSDLSHRLEGGLKLKQEPEIQIFLRNLSQKLSEQDPELQKSSVGVLLVRDGGEKWRSFSLPGNRVYLSVYLLKQLNFENEVAALLAFELAHLKRRDALNRMQKYSEPEHPEEKLDSDSAEGLVLPRPGESEKPVKFFGPDGIFMFDADSHLAAIPIAVELLYGAGYDARGLVSLWNIFKNHPNESPFDRGLLEKLTEQTRNEITQRSPLRNPIVRTPQFLKIKRYISKL